MRVIRRQLRKKLPDNYLFKFIKIPFTDSEKNYISKCIKQQNSDYCYQLTVAQWETLKKIEKKHGIGWIETYEKSFKKRL